MSQCVPLWVYPAWDSLYFLGLTEFSAIISSIFSQVLSSSSGITRRWMLVHLMLSQRFLRLFLLSFIFYILFCTSDFHHSVLQVIYLFFSLSYSAIDFFQYIIHLCLFFSSPRSLIYISWIFSIVFLNHPHYHYSELFFSGMLPISTSFSCFYGVLSWPFIWDISFCLVILISFL